FIEDGPVEPLQPPRILLQITKYLLVSTPMPSPIRLFHQPPDPVTWASPLSACKTRMALDLSLLRVPKVSYASVIGPRVSPDSRISSAGDCAKLKVCVCEFSSLLILVNLYASKNEGDCSYNAAIDLRFRRYFQRLIQIFYDVLWVFDAYR